MYKKLKNLICRERERWKESEITWNCITCLGFFRFGCFYKLVVLARRCWLLKCFFHFFRIKGSATVEGKIVCFEIWKGNEHLVYVDGVSSVIDTATLAVDIPVKRGSIDGGKNASREHWQRFQNVTSSHLATKMSQLHANSHSGHLRRFGAQKVNKYAFHVNIIHVIISTKM